MNVVHFAVSLGVPHKRAHCTQRQLTRLFRRVTKRIREFVHAHRFGVDVAIATSQLVGFVLFMSSLIYLHQAAVNDKINSFVDALYFTVTTLTTTGFGDITAVGEVGKLLIVITMIVGIGLFLKLINRIFVGEHNYTACTSCRYARHDKDAAHCKRCGTELDQSTCE